jgi:hypothetical protein
VLARLLRLLWVLLGSPGSVESFPFPSLDSANEVLRLESAGCVSQAEYNIMGHSSTRLTAATVDVDQCVRRCVEKERLG